MILVTNTNIRMFGIDAIIHAVLSRNVLYDRIINEVHVYMLP